MEARLNPAGSSNAYLNNGQLGEVSIYSAYRLVHVRILICLTWEYQSCSYYETLFWLSDDHSMFTLIIEFWVVGQIEAFASFNYHFLWPS